MTKQIRYTMTSKEALLKAIDLVLDANIPGLRKNCGKPMRDYLLAEETHGIGGSQSFAWEQAFALCVTMYIDFGRIYSGAGEAPVEPKVSFSFSYSGTTHDLASAVAINELHRRVVALGAMIQAVLSRETIKSEQLSWKEERLAADKKDARNRYQEHLLREVGDLCPVKEVDKHDIGFTFKEDAKTKKTKFTCGASKQGSSVACGHTAKYAVWIGRAWVARCGRHPTVLQTNGDPIVDILADYEKDYGLEFLTSKPGEEEEAA